MSEIKWGNITAETLKQRSQEVKNMTKDEYNRFYFGVFECDPMTDDDLKEMREFKIDEQEYLARKRNKLD